MTSLGCSIPDARTLPAGAQLTRRTESWCPWKEAAWVAPELLTRQTLQVSSSDALASSELSVGEYATSKTLA